MNELDLRYIAHITLLTRTVRERWRTAAPSLRELIAELDDHYPGFQDVFVHPQSGGLNLNAGIYYRDQESGPISVTDLDVPIRNQGIVTFW